jgi:predicted ATPase/DNA-binding SARP family transcriptional activator
MAGDGDRLAGLRSGTGYAHNQLGCLALFDGRFTEAEALYRQCHDLIVVYDGADNLDCVAYQALGRLRLYQGRYAEAEPILARGPAQSALSAVYCVQIDGCFAAPCQSCCFETFSLRLTNVRDGTTASEEVVAQLELFVFGPPRLTRAGSPCEISLKKALALFVYLAVTRQQHSRDSLATLFWPENSQREARANLRRTLYRINEIMGDQWLTAGAETIGLAAGADFWLDSELFQRHLAEGLAHGGAESLPPDCQARLSAAVQLYTDDFLAGFTLPDCPAFDDWQYYQREELRRTLATALEQLVQSYQAAGEYEQAIGYARRWLALDTLYEPAHRQLMQLYAWSGQYAAALRQYAECERIMAEEFDAPPEQETQALLEAIRTKQLAPPMAPSSVTIARQSVLRSAPPPRRHNLPAQTTPFVGREQELAEILDRVRNPACRLLTLAGPGGVGKTRLALQAGQLALDAGVEPAGETASLFRDGVFFIPLASARTPTEIPTLIAAALEINLYRDAAAQEQLLAGLGNRSLLLILDNFDHLLEGADLVADLVAAAPGVKVLVTSREALNLAEEWFHPVGGLSFPASDDEMSQPLAEYGAMRLFEQCAHRARIDFSLAEDEIHALRICRLVDGLPLAIELAAAWLKTLPTATIADEIERGIDILTTQQRNVPERHRNMRAVLEQTWKMLAPKEQEVLMRLAIFRSGFRQDAAAQVTGASLLTLATLVEKSLVRATANGRYQLHELLRQFAGERLAAHLDQEPSTRAKHSRFYLQLLAGYESQLYNKHQHLALADLSAEIDNIQAAWEWALAAGELEAVEQAVEPLYQFYWTRSRGLEGATIFSQALAHLQATPQLRHHPRYDHLLRHLLVQRGIFHFFLGDYEASEEDTVNALLLSRRLGEQSEIAEALIILGMTAAWRGERAVAQDRFEESRALFEQSDNSHGLADVLHHLAMLHLQFGDYAEGHRLASESLMLCRDLERADWTAWAHDALGWHDLLTGAYDSARSHYEQALALFESIGHERGVSLALGGLGMVAWAQGSELAQARELNEQSLAIMRRIGYRLHIASRLSVLALIANDMGDFETARTYAHEGLASASETGSPIFMAYNLFALVECAYRQGDFATARRHLRELLIIAGQTGLLDSLAVAFYHTAALLLLEAGDLALAANSHQGALAVRLLRCITEHSTCWHTYRLRAQQLLEQSSAHFPVDTPAKDQNQVCDFRVIAAELIDIL